MIKLLAFMVCVLITEIILAMVFHAAAGIFYKKLRLDRKSIFKGFAERLFLLIALSHNYSQALTFFSAVKLATRLKREDVKGEQDRFNDYYLVGNLLSVAVGMGYVDLWMHFDVLKTAVLKLFA